MLSGAGVDTHTLRFTCRGKTSGVGLDVFDRAALDGVGLPAVVFLRLELGPNESFSRLIM
jgi:hypothetical protein